MILLRQNNQIFQSINVYNINLWFLCVFIDRTDTSGSTLRLLLSHHFKHFISQHFQYSFAFLICIFFCISICAFFICVKFRTFQGYEQHQHEHAHTLELVHRHLLSKEKISEIRFNFILFKIILNDFSKIDLIQKQNTAFCMLS